MFDNFFQSSISVIKQGLNICLMKSSKVFQIAKLHKSMLPFGSLTKEVQDLDNPYVEKLNEILNYFKGLRHLIEVSNVNE